MSESVASTSGAVGPKNKRPENRRVSVRFQACAAGVLLGWVASLVAVANGGGFVSVARPAHDQRSYQGDAWQIAAALGDLDGASELSGRRSSSEGFVAGQSPHAFTPNAHVRTIAFMDDAQSAGFRLAAVRADRTESASTPARRLERTAAAPEAGTAQDSQAAERSDDVLAPAWNWMRDANRSYHQNVVPRIKQHGETEGSPAEGERARLDRDTIDRAGDVSRNLRIDREKDAGTPRPTGTNYNLSEDISNWLASARRGYGNEVVPRLKGLTPDVRIARPRDDAKDEETDAHRRLRLERERRISEAAARTAEQERLDAERRRLDAESRRKSVEAEAARIAGERRRADEEEALKLAEEKRRALERRAEEERLAAEEKRRREAQDQSEQARERDVAADREKEAEAERARQRAADRDRETAEARRRREATEAAENERKRRGDEEGRRAAERQRLEQEGRDRLIAQAEAIRRRQAAAELRAREEGGREVRSERLARAEPKEERPRPQLPGKRPLASPNEGVNRFVRRDTTIELTTTPRGAPRVAPLRTSPRAAQPTPAATPPIPQRQTDRFVRRNTTIELAPTVRGRTSDTSGSPAPTDTTASSVRLRPTRTASISKRTRRPGASDDRCRDRAGRLITPPGTYVVARGDSLWTISRRHYRLGRLFPKIYKANMAKIRRANLIFPCQRFHLPRK